MAYLYIRYPSLIDRASFPNYAPQIYAEIDLLLAVVFLLIGLPTFWISANVFRQGRRP